MNFTKRIISIFLIVFIFIGLLPPINAEGAISMPKAGADGFIAPISEPDPDAIKIYTAQDLANIKNNLSGSYVLMNDIDLSDFNGGIWKPLGDNDYNFFQGIFDGAGYKIITWDHHFKWWFEKLPL